MGGWVGDAVCVGGVVEMCDGCVNVRCNVCVCGGGGGGGEGGINGPSLQQILLSLPPAGLCVREMERMLNDKHNGLLPLILDAPHTHQLASSQQLL